jgi:hypothetical protein
MRQVTGRGAARSPAHEVQQSLAEVRALWAPLETARWVEADGGMFQRVWRSYARRLGTLCEAQMTLKRLQTQLLGTRWRRRTAPASGAAEASEEAVGRGEAGGVGAGGGGNQAQGAEGGAALPGGTAPRSGGQRPGSGRLGAEADEGAERVECRHEDWRRGEGHLRQDKL